MYIDSLMYTNVLLVCVDFAAACRWKFTHPFASHWISSTFYTFRSASYYAGLCYIYIKVPIIAFVELGIFTAFCGLWIDACSLASLSLHMLHIGYVSMSTQDRSCNIRLAVNKAPHLPFPLFQGMFNASVAQRLRAFNYAPVVFSFIHWTMGLMYLFYVSSLFIIIRDVIRPGVLWFLPDFTDPDYRPVQDVRLSSSSRTSCRAFFSAAHYFIDAYFVSDDLTPCDDLHPTSCCEPCRFLFTYAQSTHFGLILIISSFPASSRWRE